MAFGWKWLSNAWAALSGGNTEERTRQLPRKLGAAVPGANGRTLDELDDDEREFATKWGFVSKRFDLQRRLAADIEEAARLRDTPHPDDPRFSSQKIRGIGEDQLKAEFAERPMTAGYEPMRSKPLPDLSDAPDLFILADGLAFLDENGALHVIPARNQENNVRDERISQMGTYSVSSKDETFAVVDKSGRKWLSSYEIVKAGYPNSLDFHEYLMRDVGLVASRNWDVPLNRRCTVIALTSGLDDSVPFKADYDTHVKYHKLLGFPVLSRAEFELKSKTLPNAGLLPAPARKPSGSEPGGMGF